MRTRFQSTIVLSEVREFADDLRRIFQELDRLPGILSAGECSPPLDIRETDDGIEVLIDLPGVDPEAVRVVVRGPMVLVAGEKRPRRGRGESSFHLVERDFGRFARALRLPVACDTSRARAVLSAGILRLTFPRIEDRRGASINLVIEREP